MNLLITRLPFAVLLALSPLVTTSPPATLDGSWRSDGYGLFVEVNKDAVKIYQVTAISSIESDSVSLTQLGENRWSTTAGAEDSFLLTLEPDPNERLRLAYEGAASDIHLVRTEESRPSFADKDPKDRLYNFDVFCKTFSEHYPFFALKGVQWEEQVQAQRARLKESCSEEELFDAMVTLIEPLEDSHVYLESADDDEYNGFRHDDYDTDGEDAFLRRARRGWRILERTFFDSAPRSFANENVVFATLRNDIGYMRISGFSDFGEGSFADQLVQWGSDLDQMLGADLNGLVIDLRVNFGGSDIFGLALASRLAQAPYPAYRKVARNDPLDAAALTAPQLSQVEPKGPGFAGSVVVLTSRFTISAGETFTQALMGRKPTVIRVGRSTQGVFSDVLSRQLPNGWELGLPNELFLDERGRSFDGPGIEPDYSVPVFERPDLEVDRDPAMEKALELLSE